MKTTVQYFRLCIMCMSLLLLTSCAQDDETIFDSITGYTWVGDLGFTDEFGEPLESGLYFDYSGFGTDDQCYYDDPSGIIVCSLPFRWKIEDGTLSLDYGNQYPLLEIRDVYVTWEKITGTLYVDGYVERGVTLYKY